MLLEYLLAIRPAVQESEVKLKIHPEFSAKFEQAYIATELAVRSWDAALQGDQANAFEAQRLLRLAYEANHDDRWVTFSLADQMMKSLPQMVANGQDRRSLLQAILSIRPDHIGALKALWQLELKTGNVKMAGYYRERVVEMSPLDRDVNSPQETRP